MLRSLIFWLVYFPLATAAAAPQDQPPMPFHDWGACPFECCTYREWTAVSPVTAFKSRDERGAIAFQVRRNERVVAISGVVVTHKTGVLEARNPTKVGYLPGSKDPVLSLKPGDRVYALHYVGEGNEVFWYQGKTYVDEIPIPAEMSGESSFGDFKVLSRPRYVWWAKLRNRAGNTGWTRRTNLFGNKDACG